MKTVNINHNYLYNQRYTEFGESNTEYANRFCNDPQYDSITKCLISQDLNFFGYATYYKHYHRDVEKIIPELSIIYSFTNINLLENSEFCRINGVDKIKIVNIDNISNKLLGYPIRFELNRSEIVVHTDCSDIVNYVYRIKEYNKNVDLKNGHKQIFTEMFQYFKDVESIKNYIDREYREYVLRYILTNSTDYNYSNKQFKLENNKIKADLAFFKDIDYYKYFEDNLINNEEVQNILELIISLHNTMRHKKYNERENLKLIHNSVDFNIYQNTNDPDKTGPFMSIPGYYKRYELRDYQSNPIFSNIIRLFKSKDILDRFIIKLNSLKVKYI